MNEKDATEFYDDFIASQLKSGINERIFSLFEKTISNGLNPGSIILELGCGIGTLTYLLSKIIKTGFIEAVDFSPKSIEFARQALSKKNVTFEVADITTYKPALKNPDFITLFDILEHIPMDRHDELFRNLSSYISDKTTVLINIPNPSYLEYSKKHYPGALQIIDQPLPLPFIVQTLENNGLVIQRFETYSIWVKDDYQFFIVTKKNEFQEISLNVQRNIFQKLSGKIVQVIRRNKYRYP